MYFYFDESGDYAFPDDRFDCYVQAALICPGSLLHAVDAFVAERKAHWEVDELHAVELDDEQLVEVAQFVGESGCYLFANVTDTDIVSKKRIERFRLDQAGTLERNLDWYRRESTKAQGAPVPEIEQWMLRHIKRAGLAAQITHGEFVQAHYMLELIADALQKSLIVYRGDPWRDDFHDFHFVLDGKLPEKMAAGEKYLNDSIVPVLGSRPKDRGLDVLDTWHEEPRHPFVEKFGLDEGVIRGQAVQGAIDLRLIFEHGLAFDDSVDHAGLQLTDAVAYLVRRAVLEADNTAIQRAYDAFRVRLWNGQRGCLTIAALNAGGMPDASALARYVPLYHRTRAA